MEHPQRQKINKDSCEHSIKEQEFPLGLASTLGETGNAIAYLDGANLTPKQESRLREIKKKIAEQIGKFLRVARRAIAVGAIIGLSGVAGETATTIINYEMNHPVLRETVDASGQTIYVHPDERTTHYLNILAGKDKFTDEDLKFANENDRTAEDLNKLAGFEKFTDDDVERMDKDIYSLVWKLEEESGNPRIRFEEEGKPSAMVSSKNAFYDVKLNVVYIDIDDLISGMEVVAEMSHGKQFKDSPLESYLLVFRDFIKVYLNRFSTEGFEEAYDRLYNTPGSVEYQAHKVIQPDLENRYPITPHLKQIKDKDSE